jgi:acetyltransferase-like isoleucine patch superfamily enzyme
VLAANSVVRGDVRAAMIVAGVPARPIKEFQVSSGCWERA